MRIASSLVLITALAAGAHAQGTVTFNNRLSSNVFAPVFDVDGAKLLDGTNYFAQLYAGPLGSMEASLKPVGKPVSLRSGKGAGSWHSAQLVVPSIKTGERAALQVRVWFNKAGTLQSYEAASAEGVVRGKCPVFTSLPLGGGMGFPPSIINNIRATNNMQPIVCFSGKEPDASPPAR